MKMTRSAAPRERGGPYLTVTVSHKEVQRRPIKDALVIGRSLDCDLWLDDPMMSRRHCQLEEALEGDGWVVIDLGSRNGTFVNAKRVEERAPLNHGDVITVGKAHLTFHAHGYQPPRPADPQEAMRMPPERLNIARREGPHRPLPTPKVSNSETMMPISDVEPASKPLPFTRPPARPIVKPSDEQE